MWFEAKQDIDQFWQSLDAKAQRGRLNEADLLVLADFLEEEGDSSVDTIRWMGQNHVYPGTDEGDHRDSNFPDVKGRIIWSSSAWATPHGRTPEIARPDGHIPWILHAEFLRAMTEIADTYNGTVDRMSNGDPSDIRFPTVRDAINAFLMTASIAGEQNALLRVQPPTGWRLGPGEDAVRQFIDAWRRLQGTTAKRPIPDNYWSRIDNDLHRLTRHLPLFPADFKASTPVGKIGYYDLTRDEVIKILQRLPDIAQQASQEDVCGHTDICRDIAYLLKHLPKLI